MVNQFLKNTLGELVFSNTVQAAQIVELQQQLSAVLAENEKLKEQVAALTAGGVNE